jgi:hypothetical protein
MDPGIGTTGPYALYVGPDDPAERIFEITLHRRHGRLTRETMERRAVVREIQPEIHEMRELTTALVLLRSTGIGVVHFAGVGLRAGR